MLGMNLIDHQNNAIALAKIGSLANFAQRPDAPGWIMRRAQKPKLWFVALELFFDKRKVEMIAVVFNFKRIRQYLYALALCRHGKRVINRRIHHHAIARLTKCLYQVVQRRNGAIGEGYPIALDVDVMAVALEADNGIIKLIKAVGVAKGSVFNNPLETVNDGGWRCEIHVGNPQRNEILWHLAKARADK